MNKYKIYPLFLMALFLITVLVGCGSQAGNNSRNDSNKEIVNVDAVSPDNSDNITNGTTDAEKYTSLLIGSGCIGCGHCIRFDSEHFSKNQTSRIPDVISLENLNSTSLNMAISNCPVKVISRL